MHSQCSGSIILQYLITSHDHSLRFTVHTKKVGQIQALSRFCSSTKTFHYNSPSIYSSHKEKNLTPSHAHVSQYLCFLSLQKFSSHSTTSLAMTFIYSVGRVEYNDCEMMMMTTLKYDFCHKST